MKIYIRTKDGRIYDTRKCISEIFPFNPKHGMSWEFEDGAEVNEHDVDMQANRIETLCDHFVVKDDKGGYWSTHTLYAAKKKYEKGGVALYGANWTDKGLTYMAKMNGEGELELL